jgi:hypothetical protein
VNITAFLENVDRVTFFIFPGALQSFVCVEPVSLDYVAVGDIYISSIVARSQKSSGTILIV